MTLPGQLFPLGSVHCVKVEGMSMIAVYRVFIAFLRDLDNVTGNPEGQLLRSRAFSGPKTGAV
jgi:hypothetical protein